jgi:hypothetical protein
VCHGAPSSARDPVSEEYSIWRLQLYRLWSNCKPKTRCYLRRAKRLSAP